MQKKKTKNNNNNNNNKHTLKVLRASSIWHHEYAFNLLKINAGDL